MVRRRWSSRPGVRTVWERARRRTRRSADGATTAGDVSLVSAILIEDGAVLLRWAVIAVVAVVLLLATTFLLAAELAILALVVLVGVAGRVVLGRPWTVEAVSDAGDRLTWRAVGWRASARRRDEIADLLRAGVTLPPGDPADDPSV